MSRAFLVNTTDDESRVTCEISHISFKVPLQCGSKKKIFNVDVPVLKLKDAIKTDAQLVMFKAKAEKRGLQFTFQEQQAKARKIA